MRATLIVAILLSVLLTVFALANNESTEINYLLGKVDLPKSLLLMLTLASGVLIMFLFNIPSWWKNRQEKTALKKEITQLKTKLESLTNQPHTKPTNTDEFLNDVEKE